jgi:hypothetical protein
MLSPRHQEGQVLLFRSGNARFMYQVIASR